MKLKHFLMALAVMLIATGAAHAAAVVTEFEGSRAGVREFCERPGRELSELGDATMCTVIRSGVTIYCDNGGACFRQGYDRKVVETGGGSLSSPGLSAGTSQPSGGGSSGGGSSGGGSTSGGGAPTGGGGEVVIIGTGTYNDGGGSNGGTGGGGSTGDGGGGAGGGGGGIDNPPTQQN